MNIPFLLSILIAYVSGSIPFGLIVAKRVRGIDLRDHGSKNIGATNVFRVIGKKWGFFVFFLDVSKGVFAVWLGSFFFQETSFSLNHRLLFGLCAILGHTFPCWLNFKGGKGVATSLGVFLSLVFLPTLIAFLAWILVFLYSRIISLSSMVAAVLLPPLILILCRPIDLYFPLLIVSCLLCLFIFYTHRTNIGRLLRGEEKKII